MSKPMPTAARRAFYTPRQAAWILNVPTATLSRAIRTGALRTVRRRSRLVIPAAELARLLGDQVDTCSPEPDHAARSDCRGTGGAG